MRPQSSIKPVKPCQDLNKHKRVSRGQILVSFFRMVELPFDVIVHIATFLGSLDALHVSLGCQALKRKLHAVYIHEKPIPAHRIKNNLFGRFANVTKVEDDRLFLLEPRLFKAIETIEFDIDPREVIGMVFHWPPQVKRVIHNPFPDRLPHSLLALHFNVWFNHPISQLPNHLQQLDLGGDFDHPIDRLPTSLKKLQFSLFFDQRLPSLPPFLEELHFGMEFDQAVEEWPKTLRVLEFGDCFNQPLKHLPAHLEELTLGRYFEQPDFELPSSLITLHFDCEERELKNLPSNLRTLKLGENFRQHIGCLSIPQTLVKIMSRPFGTEWREVELPYHGNCVLKEVLLAHQLDILEFRPVDPM